jgi:hypothetical protein
VDWVATLPAAARDVLEVSAGSRDEALAWSRKLAGFCQAGDLPNS